MGQNQSLWSQQQLNQAKDELRLVIREEMHHTIEEHFQVNMKHELRQIIGEIIKDEFTPMIKDIFKAELTETCSKLERQSNLQHEELKTDLRDLKLEVHNLGNTPKLQETMDAVIETSHVAINMGSFTDLNNLLEMNLPDTLTFCRDQFSRVDFFPESSIEKVGGQHNVGNSRFQMFKEIENSRLLLIWTSEDKVSGPNFILELFQCLSFYYWDTTKSIGWILQEYELKLGLDVNYMIESLVCVPLLFCHYGLPISKIDLAVKTETYSKKRLSNILKSVNNEYFQDRKLSGRKPPFLLLYHGQTDLSMETEVMKRANELGCLVDMDSVINSHSKPLGSTSLNILSFIVPTDLVIVYKAENAEWTLSNEYICLLALIQQRASNKQFVVFRNPKMNEAPKINKSDVPSFLQAIGHVSTDETVDSIVERFSQPVPETFEIVSASSNSARRESGELTRDLDVTILYDYSKHRDSDLANSFDGQLRINGFSVYTPPKSLEDPGFSDIWNTAKSIQKSKIVIVLLSKSYLEHPERAKEFTLALWYHSVRNLGCTLLPICSSTNVTENLEVSKVFSKENSFRLMNRQNGSIINLKNVDAMKFIVKKVLVRSGNTIKVNQLHCPLVVYDLGHPHIDMTVSQTVQIGQWIQNCQNNPSVDFPLPLPSGYGWLNDGRLKIKDVLFQPV